MVYPGHLIGEFGLLNGHARNGTLTATEDCEMLVLRAGSFAEMERNDPYLALVFSKICMVRLPCFLLCCCILIADLSLFSIDCRDTWAAE